MHREILMQYDCTIRTFEIASMSAIDTLDNTIKLSAIRAHLRVLKIPEAVMANQFIQKQVPN
jgi:hypothetical protein